MVHCEPLCGEKVGNFGISGGGRNHPNIHGLA